jgi:hypothetical protein
MADLEIVHPGSIEAGDVMASAVDGAGCAIDYDIPSATARVTAKGTNNTGSSGLFFCSAGTANLVSSIGGEHAAGYNVASKISLGANAGSMIVTNNMGVSRTVNVTAIRTRAAN